MVDGDSEKDPSCHQEWVRRMAENPDLAKDFSDWDRLGGFNIARLLSRQPQFAERVGLRKLKPLAWIRLLRKQPQFAAQCDKWDEIRKYAPALVARLHCHCE